MPPENGEEEKWHQPECQPATDEEKKKITAMAGREGRRSSDGKPCLQL